MTHLTKKQRKSLEEIIENVEALIQSCRGNETKCCVFNSLSKDYKHNIDLYTSSWILPNLKKLLEETT